MRLLQPFFLLAGRAVMFWLGLVALISLSIVIAALTQPDAPPSAYIDAAFLAAFAFPAVAGWLAGVLIQELQHCSFVWPLPSARSRIAIGFLTLGLTITLLVVGVITLRGSGHSPLVLGAVGMGAFCLGGVFVDPLSRWWGFFNASLALAIAAMSPLLGELSAAHPVSTVVLSAGIGTLCLHRLFGVSTFRNKPFTPTNPLPGSFSLNQIKRYERDKLVRERPSDRQWRSSYLKVDIWSWVQAAIHETHGPLRWSSLPGLLLKPWPLWLILVAHAWAEKGDEGFGTALGKTIFDGLLRSPHSPPFGEKGPYLMVAIMISAIGAMLALWAPVALKSGMLYPLSREDLVRITFRGGLVEAGGFLLTVGLGLLLIGQAAGWLVGYETRLDFVPFYLRPLLATVILLPAARWGRLHLHAATLRKTEDTWLALMFGLIGFATLACLWAFLSPKVLTSPLAELAASAALLLISHLIYRTKLERYFATADLD